MMNIAVIDYGINNIYSIVGAVKKLGYEVDIIKNQDSIFNSRKIILPGVGAFKAGMQALEKRGLKEFLVEKSKEDYSILGICLGFQMLMTKSYEFGECDGLGIISGEVKKLNMLNNFTNQKIPNNGWRQLKISDSRDLLFDNIKSSDYFYFIHSYFVEPVNKNLITSKCMYKGLEITASIRNKNIFGTQFHPEKSGKRGLEILNKFITAN